MYCHCNIIPASSFKNLGGVVAWVAFVVALAAAYIPLRREGGLRVLICSFSCHEQFFEESDVVLVLIYENYSHFKIYIYIKERLINKKNLDKWFEFLTLTIKGINKYFHQKFRQIINKCSCSHPPRAMLTKTCHISKFMSPSIKPANLNKCWTDQTCYNDYINIHVLWVCLFVLFCFFFFIKCYE